MFRTSWVFGPSAVLYLARTTDCRTCKRPVHRTLQRKRMRSRQRWAPGRHSLCNAWTSAFKNNQDIFKSPRFFIRNHHARGNRSEGAIKSLKAYPENWRCSVNFSCGRNGTNFETMANEARFQLFRTIRARARGGGQIGNLPQ